MTEHSVRVVAHLDRHTGTAIDISGHQPARIIGPEDPYGDQVDIVVPTPGLGALADELDPTIRLLAMKREIREQYGADV